MNQVNERHTAPYYLLSLVNFEQKVERGVVLQVALVASASKHSKCAIVNPFVVAMCALVKDEVASASCFVTGA